MFIGATRTDNVCTKTLNILAREGAKKRTVDFPDTATMAEAFSQENALWCLDLLGDLDKCVGDTKQERKKDIENYKPATTGMAVIVPHSEMGN
eukprot:13753534-Heterocapsa_arctica.AAC.1